MYTMLYLAVSISIYLSGCCCFFHTLSHTQTLIQFTVSPISNYSISTKCIERKNEWNREPSSVQLAAESERIKEEREREGLKGEMGQTETALFCCGRSVTSPHCLAALLCSIVCVCVFVWKLQPLWWKSMCGLASAHICTCSTFSLIKKGKTLMRTLFSPYSEIEAPLMNVQGDCFSVNTWSLM